MNIFFIFRLLAYQAASLCIAATSEKHEGVTATPEEWLGKVKENVEQIKSFMRGTNKGVSYYRMSYITDTFGPRLAGSDALEKVIDTLKHDAKKDNFSVKEEPVQVTNWREISSKATFHSQNRSKSLAIVAYGPSVAGKLKAPVVLVKSFDELKKRSSEVKGKIVVYNQECRDYPSCVQYRNDGASKAAEYGAVASLTRSIAPFSIYKTHTGHVTYKNKLRIPAAAITIEDAAFIERILERDPKATIDLDIQTEIGPDKTSRNLIIDIPGSDIKQEVLLSGAHLDSWHVDDGVTNNAVGCNILYESLRVIQNLGLKPKRTLRVVLWTAGEQNSKGERQFFVNQKEKNEQIRLIMRSERGAFNISGLIINNSDNLKAGIQKIFDRFFKDWNLVAVSNLTVGENTSQWVADAKVPRLDFLANMKRYAEVYNSGGDTLEKLTAEEVDKAVTVWASILYTLGTAD